MKKITYVLLLVTLTFAINGCKDKTESGPSSQDTAAKKVVVINNKCPIMGNDIDPVDVPPQLIRVYNGKNVGFCCLGCPQAWDKLSDKEKDTKLKEATK